MPKVSVIVPVYNLENYVSGCLESIIHQDYSDVEIIIVDDGSTDNTYAICKDLAFRYKEKDIKLVTQSNAGVSDARNRGMGLSSGEYVVFVDGDDALCKNYISSLMRIAITNNADIVSCNPMFVDSIENRDRASKEVSEVLTTKMFTSRECLKDFLSGKYSGSSCEKLFKKDIISNLLFPVGVKNNEDKYFTFNALLVAKRVCSTEASMYICLERQSSATRDKYLFNIDSVLISERIVDSVSSRFPHDEELCISAYSYLTIAIIYNIRVLIRKQVPIKEKKEMFLILRHKLDAINKNNVRIGRTYIVEWKFISVGYFPYWLFVRSADGLKGFVRR